MTCICNEKDNFITHLLRDVYFTNPQMQDTSDASCLPCYILHEVKAYINHRMKCYICSLINLPQIKLVIPKRDYKNTHKNYIIEKIITNTRI